MTSTPNFDLQNRLVGSEFGTIRDFVFDNVVIDGELVDQDYVDARFTTNEYLGEMTFR